MSLDSFRVAKVLGKGSYGTVLHVQHKQTNQAYALKVMALALPCWWHWHALPDLMALCDCCWHWHSVIAANAVLHSVIAANAVLHSVIAADGV